MILTINSSDIVNSLLFCCYPTSLKSLNNQYKEIMYDTLREKKKNIIIVDFVDEEFINICLNFKLLSFKYINNSFLVILSIYSSFTNTS